MQTTKSFTNKSSGCLLLCSPLSRFARLFNPMPMPIPGFRFAPLLFFAAFTCFYCSFRVSLLVEVGFLAPLVDERLLSSINLTGGRVWTTSCCVNIDADNKVIHKQK